jgi:type IX secretion system PorP/SprF family membrane protein
VKKFLHYLPVFVFILTAFAMRGQDIHFSQYGNSPINLSPGLTGVFGCDMRFAANYRNQWRSVRVPYSTFAGSIENKFYHKKGQYNRYFTGALLLDYDKQGLLELSSYVIGLSGSYTHSFGSRNFLTAGLLGSFNGRQFNTNKLTTDAQYLGKTYNSANPNGETINNKSVNYGDLSGGANWRWNNATKRHKVDFGVGFHHITRPKQNFFAEKDVRLNSRMAFYALGSFGVTKRLDFVPQLVLQRQGTYREFVPSAMVRYYLNPNVYQPVALGFGAAVRTGYRDAIVPQVELLLGTWQFGFSYDINTSKFDRATDGRGGPEFSAIYRLCKVKPLPMFKICPII